MAGKCSRVARADTVGFRMLRDFYGRSGGGLNARLNIALSESGRIVGTLNRIVKATLQAQKKLIQKTIDLPSENDLCRAIL